MGSRVRLMTATGALFVALVACGSSDGPALSEEGERGRTIALSNGCAGCHGANGQGGAGPTYIGLAGSEIELRDGTIIVADRAYLERSITDPEADLRAGWDLQMPRNRLTDAEVDAVVAYIEELAESG